MSKSTAKAATTVKTPAKPAAKPAAKTATAKPAAKAAPAAKKPAAQAPAAKAPTAKTAPAKTAPAKTVPAKTAPTKTAPIKTVPAKSPAAQRAAAPAKAAAKPAPPPSPLPTPAPSAGGNRFTDRFAPAAPAPRPMTPTADTPAKPAQKVDPKLANAWKTKSGAELSEAELLAMPDSEYMNDKQVEFFRNRLQQQKNDLLSNAGETTEHLREDTSIVPDPVDRATIEEEHALELRTRDRERKLLKKIAQSLARLDSGEYGYCDETGEPIGLGRLLARPTATLSLEAQQRRELKQKMFGD